MGIFTDDYEPEWESHRPRPHVPVVWHYRYDQVIGKAVFKSNGNVVITISDPRVREQMRADAVTIITGPAVPSQEDATIALAIAIQRIEKLEAENAKMQERLDYWDSWTYLGSGSSGNDRYMELVQRGTAGR